MEYKEIITSKEFIAWFGDWQTAYKEAGLDFKHTAWKNVSKAVDGIGQPLKLYHGTTHEWTKYSRKLGNHENDMGIGFYTTSDKYDAEKNYLSKGFDITAKTSFYAENLSEKKKISLTKAKKIIKDKFVGDTEKIMVVFLKIKRPLVIATSGFEGTFFDFSTQFNEETEEYTDSQDLLDFKQAFEDVCEDFELSYNITNRAWEGFMGNIGELDYISAYRIIKSIKSIDFLYDYLQNEELGGNNVYEFISQVFQKLRFDGAIYLDASQHFKNMNISEGTEHLVAFKPNQIKLADGSNTKFSSKNNDIRFADGGGIENTEPIYEWWFKDATNKTEKKLEKQYGITQTMIDFYGERLYKKRVSIPTTHNDWIPIVTDKKFTFGGFIGSVNTDKVESFTDECGIKRFKIDDISAKFNDDIVYETIETVNKSNIPQEYKMSEILYFWDGYTYYPNLSDVIIVFYKDELDNQNAVYDATTNEISINCIKLTKDHDRYIEHTRRNEKTYSEQGNNGKNKKCLGQREYVLRLFRRKLLHECQHILQLLEGIQPIPTTLNGVIAYAIKKYSIEHLSVTDFKKFISDKHNLPIESYNTAIYKEYRLIPTEKECFDVEEALQKEYDRLDDSEGMKDGGELVDSATSRFNLPIPKDLNDIESGVDEIISQYANRKMASIQVQSYLNENKDLGLEFVKSHSLTNIYELNKYLNNRQSVLRKPILEERKKEAQEYNDIKAVVNVSAIEQLALEQFKEIDNSINDNNSEKE